MSLVKTEEEQRLFNMYKKYLDPDIKAPESIISLFIYESERIKRSKAQLKINKHETTKFISS